MTTPFRSLSVRVAFPVSASKVSGLQEENIVHANQNQKEAGHQNIPGKREVDSYPLVLWEYIFELWQYGHKHHQATLPRVKIT